MHPMHDHDKIVAFPTTVGMYRGPFFGNWFYSYIPHVRGAGRQVQCLPSNYPPTSDLFPALGGQTVIRHSFFTLFARLAPVAEIVRCFDHGLLLVCLARQSVADGFLPDAQTDSPSLEGRDIVVPPVAGWQRAHGGGG